MAECRVIFYPTAQYDHKCFFVAMEQILIKQHVDIWSLISYEHDIVPRYIVRKTGAEFAYPYMFQNK